MPRLQRFSKEEKSSANSKFVFKYLADLNCPRSLAASIMFKYGEFEQLVKLEFNPTDYNSFEDAELAIRATKFLSKNVFLKTGIDKKSVAIEGFLRAEEQCRITNQLMRSTGSERHQRFASSVLRIQRKISQLLGNFDSVELFELGGWGPGVTQRLTAGDATQPNKFRLEDGITHAAYDLVGLASAEAYPTWQIWQTLKATNPSDLPKLLNPSRNKIITVPKNSKTDRVIAVEPGLNLWFQKACGKMIRRRLLRSGINLSFSDKNQDGARAGSLDGFLSTVDFSAASDTISRSVVELLLPADWFIVLNSLRCTSGLLKNKTISYQKFSSMGNGYTFELESLLFYAVAWAVTTDQGFDPKCIAVFGDDIVLPSACFEAFRSLSEYLGFTVNEQKSYSSGYFREACGAYYWNGSSVKPFFFRKQFYDEETLYLTANSIRLQGSSSIYNTSSARHRSTWRYLVHLLRGLTHDDVLKVPNNGMTGLVCNFDEACPAVARGGLEGFRVRHLVQVAIPRVVDHHGVLLTRLSEVGNSSSAHLNNEYSRGRTKLRILHGLVPRWLDPGPWI